MNGYDLKNAIRQGKRVYGTLIASTSPRWMKLIKKAGLDFVFIDTEHVPIDRDTLSWMCYGYDAMGLVPVVRIPASQPHMASQVLDGGARGVMAPYVETPEEVRALVGAVKYKPVKGKKLDDFLSGRADFEPELAQYIEHENRNNIVLVNIESLKAIQALDEILDVPGLDGIVIGPHDLSCSMGIPEQYDHPEFDKAVRGILEKCRQKGVGAGMHFVGEADKEIAWAKEAGLHLIIHSADLYMFINTVKRDIDKIKQSMGDENIVSGEIKVNI